MRNSYWSVKQFNLERLLSFTYLYNLYIKFIYNLTISHKVPYSLIITWQREFVKRIAKQARKYNIMCTTFICTTLLVISQEYREWWIFNTKF